MAKSLYEKVFHRHTVRPMTGGHYQVLVGLHLIHEVTSPHAFQDLRERGLAVRHPERTFATQDHANPTTSLARPYADRQNEAMIRELERNVERYGIRYFSPERGEHGIVHVIGPELGLTQPGMTIACVIVEHVLGLLCLDIAGEQFPQLLLPARTPLQGRRNGSFVFHTAWRMMASLRATRDLRLPKAGSLGG